MSYEGPVHYVVMDVASTKAVGDKYGYGKSYKVKGAATRTLNKAMTGERWSVADKIERLKAEKAEIEKLGDPKGSVEKIERLIKLLEEGTEFLVLPGHEKAKYCYERPVTNLMSRKLVWERSDTPFTNSVSSETYWSS